MNDPHALAQLCAVAMPEERLTPTELEHVCFGPGTEVIGGADGAVALLMHPLSSGVFALLLLVAVHPDRAGRGLGKELIGAALDRARAGGAPALHLTGAVPRYLWPGLECTNTRAGMLFEAMGFERSLVAQNMSIDSSFRHPAPREVTVEREETSGSVELARREYPAWVDELETAQRRGEAFTARDAAGRTLGFGCHSCNRAAWIGPMATDPAAQHRGVGSAILAAVCADLEHKGHPAGEKFGK